MYSEAGRCLCGGGVHLHKAGRTVAVGQGPRGDPAPAASPLPPAPPSAQRASLRACSLGSSGWPRMGRGKRESPHAPAPKALGCFRRSPAPSPFPALSPPAWAPALPAARREEEEVEDGGGDWQGGGGGSGSASEPVGSQHRRGPRLSEEAAGAAPPPPSPAPDPPPPLRSFPPSLPPSVAFPACPGPPPARPARHGRWSSAVSLPPPALSGAARPSLPGAGKMSDTKVKVAVRVRPMNKRGNRGLGASRGGGGTGARRPPAFCPGWRRTSPLARRPSPSLPGSRRGPSCSGVPGEGGCARSPWLQPPAVSSCRAGPEYQVHRGDGREPDCASPAAFQRQARRKVKPRVAVSRVEAQSRLLRLALADASLGFVRAVAGSPGCRSVLFGAAVRRTAAER